MSGQSQNGIGHSEAAPCPNCGTPPKTLLGSEGAEVGVCPNQNCSVLQYEATRSLSAEIDRDEGDT